MNYLSNMIHNTEKEIELLDFKLEIGSINYMSHFDCKSELKCKLVLLKAER